MQTNIRLLSLLHKCGPRQTIAGTLIHSASRQQQHHILPSGYGLRTYSVVPNGHLEPQQTVVSPEPSATTPNAGYSANPRSNVTDPQDEHPEMGGEPAGRDKQNAQMKNVELQDGSGQLMPELTKGIVEDGVETDMVRGKDINHHIGRGIRGEDNSALRNGRKVMAGETEPDIIASPRP